MKPAAEIPEVRIRERAYHIWEASGRPPGRDVEFWLRACEQLASSDDQPTAGLNGSKPKRAQSAQPPRRRTRKAS